MLHCTHLSAGKPKAGGSDSARSSGDFSGARSSEDFSSEIAASLLHKAAEDVRKDAKQEPGRTDEDGGSERARCGGEGEHDDGKIAVAENGCNKDLNYIWYPDLYDVKPHKGGPFYPCDTILVDDKNIQGNDCNFRNGIMVPEFFGSAMAGKLDQDTALLEVIKKLKEVMQSPAFCSVANDRGIKELPYPFPKATKRRPTIVSGGGRRKTMKRKSSHKKTRRHRK